MRKLKKIQKLNIYEMYLFITGGAQLSFQIDEEETAKKWPEYKESLNTKKE